MSRLKQKISILLVEDDKKDAKLFQAFVQSSTRFTIEVKNAATLKDAIEEIKTATFDLIVLDLNLPDSKGILTYHKIDAVCTAPIVVLTGDDDQELWEAIFHLGGQDVLVKGTFDELALLKTIEYSISRSRFITEIEKREEKFKLIIEENADGMIVLDTDGVVIYVNAVAEQLLDRKRDTIIGEYLGLPITAKETDEIEVVGKLRKPLTLQMKLIHTHWDKKEVMIASLRDNTERKKAEQRVLLTSRILAILNRQNEWQKLIRDILTELKLFTQLDAVAIRLKDGEDFPYFETEGFPPSFIEKERSLCARDNEGKIIRDSAGKAILECMCGNIISGKFDSSKIFFTDGGSFWSNGTTQLLKSTTDDESLARTRNHCNKSGYESVALVPLKSGDEIIGLLQFNDKHQNMFEKDLIEYFEGIGTTIGIAYKRMQSEKVIKESEERFRGFYENATIGIIRTDLNGTILMANPTFLSMLGVNSLEELQSKGSIKEFFKDPELREDFYRIVKSEGTVFGYQQVMKKEDGTEIIVQESGKLIEENGGKISYYEGIVQDITDKKKSEEQIRKLYHGVQQSPTTILITDINGNIEYVNQKFVETTGYTFEDVQGKNPRILKSGTKTSEEYALLWKTILAGNDWRGEFQNKRKNGELYWESAAISPIKNEQGVVTHFIAIKEDVTEKKKMISQLIESKENAELANKLKDAFINNISHEIRTPLNGIVGFSNLIKEFYAKDASEDDQLMFSGIDSSASRIIRTVEEILNYSRLQTGEFKIMPKEIDLARLTQQIINQNIAEAGKKNIELIFDNQCSEAPIFGDEYTITQSVFNLVDNAIKYTTKGSVKVTLSKDENEFVSFEIKDTGIGMAEDYLEHLFEPYRQEEMGYGRTYEGLGLGLALTKKYLEMSKAALTVNSKKGEGTTVKIKFSKWERPKAEPAVLVKKEKIIKPQKAKTEAVILVVEDDELNKNVMHRILKNTYKSLYAASAEDVYNLLELNKVDLILMDISIQGKKNGLELTTELKATKEYAHIPVIAVTAHAYTGDRRSALQAGCNGYVVKPYSKEFLLDTIAEHLLAE